MLVGQHTQHIQTHTQGCGEVGVQSHRELERGGEHTTIAAVALCTTTNTRPTAEADALYSTATNLLADNACRSTHSCPHPRTTTHTQQRNGQHHTPTLSLTHTNKHTPLCCLQVVKLLQGVLQSCWHLRPTTRLLLLGWLNCYAALPAAATLFCATAAGILFCGCV